MSVYVNAFVMLLATITAFVMLAKLANYARAGNWLSGAKRRGRPNGPATGVLMEVEQSCVIDAKRRLVSVRCGADRLVFLVGGPTDLVVSQRPLPAAQGELA